MVTDEQRDVFFRDGFHLVPDALSPAQVKELRAFWIEEFEAGPTRIGDTDSSRPDIHCRFPAVRWVLHHEPIVRTLRGLLGDDFVYVHEFAVHDSIYGGWHKDTSSQERAGHTFHWDDSFLMLQCALYLQDNGDYGGGLDVIPGSQRTPDPYLSPPRPTFRRALRRRLIRMGLLSGGRRGQYAVPSRAGDLVVFDVRLNHRATQPRSRPVPPEHRKLAMFLMASRNNDHFDRYQAWVRTREDYQHLKDHRVCPDLIMLAREHGLRVGYRDMSEAPSPASALVG